MGIYRAKLSPDEAAAVVRPGEVLNIKAIAVRLGMSSYRNVSYALQHAAAQGLLVRQLVKNTDLCSSRGGAEVFYSVPNIAQDVVGKPYPSVLLNVAPADAAIGRELWSHAAIAMCARR